MPIFNRRTESNQFPAHDSIWNDWKNEAPSRKGSRGGSSAPRLHSYNTMESKSLKPRGILLNTSTAQETTQDQDHLKPISVSISLPGLPPPRNRPTLRQFKSSRSLSRMSSGSVRSRSNDAESDRRCSSSCSSLTAGRGDPSLSGYSHSPSLSSTCSRSRDPRSCDTGPAAHFPMPPVKQAVSDLSSVLHDNTDFFQLEDHLDPEEIALGQLWEEDEETLLDSIRDKADDEDGGDGIWRSRRRIRQMKERAQRERTRANSHMFGAHIQDLPTTALTQVVIGGYLHTVPTVVAACVQALYRTGVYQPGLFRSPPNRKRLYDLVSYFDTSARTGSEATKTTLGAYAQAPSLHREQTADVCGLLLTYLTALPDSLIHRSLCDALWAWCVSPSILRQEQRYGKNDARVSKYQATTDGGEDETEAALSPLNPEHPHLPSLDVQLLIAQHILLLLPPRYFSLLVQLFGLFSALIESATNRLSADDVSRIFGPLILAGKHHQAQDQDDSVQSDAARNMRERDRKIMLWLMRHWDRIFRAFRPTLSNSSSMSRQSSRSMLTCSSDADTILSKPMNTYASEPHASGDSPREVCDRRRRDTIRPDLIAVAQGKQCTAQGPLEEDSVSRAEDEDDASVYSNDDVVDEILDRYLDEGSDLPVYGSISDPAHLHDEHNKNQGEEIAHLRAKLEEVVKERDTARDAVAAMRQVVQTVEHI